MYEAGGEGSLFVNSRHEFGNFVTAVGGCNGMSPQLFHHLAGGSIGAAVKVSDPSGVTGSISIFQDQDLTGVTGIIILVVIILTIANALAPKFASGVSNLKIASYLSITCLISGFILGVVPSMTAGMFSG